MEEIHYAPNEYVADPAQFSEKIIGSGGRQKQAIELFWAPVSSTVK